jgi:hypothetical protein
LKCLTEILRIWELYPVSKRPSLASYLTHEHNTFTGSSQIIFRTDLNPEETYCFLEFLVCCTNSQIGFINTLFKDPSFYNGFIDVFCKHSDRITKNAKRQEEFKRVVGIFIVLVSNLIQNNKIKSNKEAKDLISQFLLVYLSNFKDTIYTLFVQRGDHSAGDFDLSVKSYDFRKSRSKKVIMINDEVLEERIRNI